MQVLKAVLMRCLAWKPIWCLLEKRSVRKASKRSEANTAEFVAPGNVQLKEDVFYVFLLSEDYIFH
jgi:hypothetical protein